MPVNVVLPAVLLVGARTFDLFLSGFYEQPSSYEPCFYDLQ
jgi:hypothetical protein